jgi:hypothetical protein
LSNKNKKTEPDAQGFSQPLFLFLSLCLNGTLVQGLLLISYAHGQEIVRLREGIEDLR